MSEYKCGDCFYADLCEKSELLLGFSRDNPAYCSVFLNSADVEPVVRCRDCKHAWIHPCGYVYCHRDGRNAYEMTFNLDSFCSYGELKEGID